MDYTKAIFLMSGEVITITDKQEIDVRAQLSQGAEWISIEGQLINTKAIAKIGSHHATSYLKKLEINQGKTDLKIKMDETKKLDWAEPDYYIDKHTGEKMYS
jgi:hypothetical protein